MNTSKQINAMIVLLLLLLVGVGLYTIWDPFRAEAEAERTKEVIAERAGHTYARNCRVCHGNAGEGRIGPALAPEVRTRSGLPDWTDEDRRAEFEPFVRNTLICGRIGKIMPPWAIEQGGSLNDEQIRQLVILLVENPGGHAWDKVAEISNHEEELVPLPPVQEVIQGSTITGATNPVCGQPTVSASPTATPTPPPVTSTVTVVSTDNKFDLAAIAVPAGQQVTLTLNNRGNALHNWNARNAKDTQGRDVKTDLIAGGATTTIRFTIGSTGTFTFVCDVHPEMVGTLFVQ